MSEVLERPGSVTVDHVEIAGIGQKAAGMQQEPSLDASRPGTTPSVSSPNNSHERWP